MDDFISINLCCSFTTRIFNVPVRGSLCTHKECFDLSTFLRTLTAKPLAKRYKFMLHRCPICRKDARPELLVIDESLGEVRVSHTQTWVPFSTSVSYIVWLAQITQIRKSTSNWPMTRACVSSAINDVPVKTKIKQINLT